MVGGLTYLLDTNVWVELLQERQNAPSVREFLRHVPLGSVMMTEFSLYSIGIILSRLDKRELLAEFLEDTFEVAGVTRLCLTIHDLKEVLSSVDSLGLDFDDAYQYVAAEKVDCIIVSFDKDFDSTPRGRMTPAQILARWEGGGT